MKKTTIERRKELLERKVGLKEIGIKRKEGEARWVKIIKIWKSIFVFPKPALPFCVTSIL